MAQQERPRLGKLRGDLGASARSRGTILSVEAAKFKKNKADFVIFLVVVVVVVSSHIDAIVVAVPDRALQLE